MSITTGAAAGDGCHPSVATLAAALDAALQSKIPRVRRPSADRQHDLLASIARRMLAH